MHGFVCLARHGLSANWPLHDRGVMRAFANVSVVLVSRALFLRSLIMNSEETAESRGCFTYVSLVFLDEVSKNWLVYLEIL